MSRTRKQKKKRPPAGSVIAHLRQICVARDLKALLTLSTSDSVYDRLTADELTEAATLLIAGWRTLVLDTAPPGKRLYSGMFEDADDDGVLAALLFIVCTHYDYIVTRQVERFGAQTTLPNPGMDPEFLEAVSHVALESQQSFQARAALLTYNYLTAVWSSFLLIVQQRSDTRSNLALVLEDVAHDSAARTLAGLTSEQVSIAEEYLRRSLAVSVLTVLNRAYHLAAVTPRKDVKNKAYLSFSLHELPSLACRDDLVMERYGAKQIEKEFERQLSLLFQSFGFFVTASAPGERSIDLICVPSEAEPSAVVLVDAKTSLHPYALPTDDQRALAEYCEHARRTLRTLPPITTVLLVGPPAAPMLAERLSQLQAELGVQIRYCEASLLKELREALVGTINQSEFVQMLHSSDGVLDSPRIQEFISQQRGKNEAITNLVTTFVQSQKSLAPKK